MANFTQISNQFTVNGVIDPTKPVLENLERMAVNSGCWLTYDVYNGKWGVVINQEGESQFSFTDDNILGPISVSGTGLSERYNAVKVSYPRGDINDQVDFVKVSTPTADKHIYEQDNTLDMTLDMCNDPVQAALIANRELKQSRVDLVIDFDADFTCQGLTAGDVIDITNNELSWTNKLFRIITIREVDDDSGSLYYSFTALEYDADVYNNDLSRLTAETNNGITTLGYISTPVTPTITLFERESRPRALFEALSPVGIIEGVEFWISTDGTNYDIFGTTRPFDNGVYPISTTVQLELDNLNAGTIYCKVRGINSTTTGAFSSVASTTYTPVQTTDAINTDTDLVDLNGSLLTAAALSTLLTLLDDLYSNGSSGPGSIFDKIFDIFNDETGVDILDTGNAFVTDSFATVSANSTSIVASGLDTLTIESGTNVTIDADALTKTVTINSTGGIGNIQEAVLAGNGITITGNASVIEVASDGKWDGASKFVSTSAPVGNVADGDVWFKI